jgi:hypothetical protein
VPFPAKPFNDLPIDTSFQARAIYENIPMQEDYWDSGKYLNRKSAEYLQHGGHITVLYTLLYYLENLLQIFADFHGTGHFGKIECHNQYYK